MIGSSQQAEEQYGAGDKEERSEQFEAQKLEELPADTMEKVEGVFTEDDSKKASKGFMSVLEKCIKFFDRKEDDLGKITQDFNFDQYISDFHKALEKTSDGIYSYRFDVYASTEKVLFWLEVVKPNENATVKYPAQNSFEEAVDKSEVPNNIKKDIQSELSKGNSEIEYFFNGLNLAMIKHIKPKNFTKKEAVSDMKFIVQYRRSGMAKDALKKKVHGIK